MTFRSFSRKMHILIADDFPAFRSLIRSKLQENGFDSVTEAADGLDAVAKAADLQPGLVLLDIGMPKLSGIDAAPRIHAVAPQSKILFISQNTDAEVAHSLLIGGTLGYVVKSAINQELLPAIDAVLHGKRFVSSCLHPIST